MEARRAACTQALALAAWLGHVQQVQHERALEKIYELQKELAYAVAWSD
jgi:hypothetical protein